MAAQTRVTNGGDLLGSAPRPQPGSAPRGRLGRLGPVIVVVLIVGLAVSDGADLRAVLTRRGAGSRS